MNQEPRLQRMRVYHLEGKMIVLGDIAYRRELEKLEKTVSGFDMDSITDDEVLRRL